MSNDRPKGIIDPWRRVAPLRPSREDRIDLEDLDHDADLAVPLQHVLRSRYASFNVVSTRLTSPASALDVLADCVGTCWKIPALRDALIAAGIGVRCTLGAWNVPSEETPSSTMKGESGMLWFAHVPLDEGMRRLARILRQAAAATTIKAHGITPMLTG